MHILKLLDCQPVTDHLPSSAICPLCCKGTIRVYSDSRSGSVWCHCRTCLFSGDAIDLAARAWQLTPDAALNRLQISSVPPPPGRRTQSRQALQRLWQESGKDLTGLSAQLSQLGVMAHSEPNWLAAAALWLRPVSIQDIRRTWPVRGLSGRGEAAFLLLEDLPGRPVSAVFRTEAGLITPTARLKRSLILGLGGLREPLETLVVHPDLLAVVSTQLRSLHELRRPLPLVGLAFGELPSPLWSQLDCRVVFWSPLTVEIIREAASCRGLCLAEPLRPGLSISGEFGRMLSRAVPWQQALAGHLETLETPAALEFLRASAITVSELREVLVGCSAAAKARLLPQLQTDPQVVTYGEHQVSLQPGGWYAGSKLLSNVTLKVLRVEEGRDPRCSIEITFGARTCRRSVRASRLESKPEHYLRWVLCRKQWGVPFVCPRWREHMFQLGYLFGNPEIVPCLPEMGWSPREQGLVLDTYCLQNNGFVRYYSRSERGAGFGRLPSPAPLSGTQIRDLNALPTLSILGGVVAYVSACLLQKLTGTVTEPLVLCGSNHSAAWYARQLDCLRIYLKSLPETAAAQSRVRTSGRHSYPVLLSLRDNQKRVEALSLLDHRGAILDVSRKHRDWELIARHASWTILPEANPGPPPPECHAVEMLVAYLRDLARRHFRFKRLPSGPLLSIWTDLQHWWTDSGGQALQSVLLCPAESVHLALRHFLGLVHPDFFVVRRGFRDCTATLPTLEHDADHIWIDPQFLARALLKRRVVADLPRLAEQLITMETLVLDQGLWRLPLALWLPETATEGRLVRSKTA